jgi:hypothetical protein
LLEPRKRDAEPVHAQMPCSAFALTQALTSEDPGEDVAQSHARCEPAHACVRMCACACCLCARVLVLLAPPGEMVRMAEAQQRPYVDVDAGVGLEVGAGVGVSVSDGVGLHV